MHCIASALFHSKQLLSAYGTQVVHVCYGSEPAQQVRNQRKLLYMATCEFESTAFTGFHGTSTKVTNVYRREPFWFDLSCNPAAQKFQAVRSPVATSGLVLLLTSLLLPTGGGSHINAVRTPIPIYYMV